MLNPYIIGWIASDGHVEDKYWVINQTEKNSEILHKINEFFSLSGVITKQTNRENSYGKNPMYTLRVKNIDDILLLSNWGIPCGNKTYSLQFPEDKYKKDIWLYLRGFFEGDGSISSPKNNSLRVEIISNIVWLEKCCKFLRNEGFNPFISLDKRHDGIGNVILRRRNQIFQFFNNLYGKTPNIFMEDKYKKFVSLLEKFPILDIERKYLSDDDKDKIAKELLSGEDVKKLSVKYACSPHPIWKIKRKITGDRYSLIKVRDEKILNLLKSGFTFEQIREKIKCGYRAIKKVRDINFPSEEEQLKEKYKKIEEYIKDGKNVKEIASELHCSFCRIAQIRRNIKNENKY